MYWVYSEPVCVKTYAYKLPCVWRLDTVDQVENPPTCSLNDQSFMSGEQCQYEDVFVITQPCEEILQNLCVNVIIHKCYLLWFEFPLLKMHHKDAHCRVLILQ